MSAIARLLALNRREPSPMRRHHRRQKRAVQLFLSSPSAGCTQSDSYTSSRKPMQRSTKNNQVDELEVRLEKAAQVFLEKQGQDTSLVEISRHLQGSFDHFLITEWEAALLSSDPDVQLRATEQAEEVAERHRRSATWCPA
ncbi:uncharacterized protein LOC144125297 isoform X3 [Amblyomma americanum]